MRMTIDIDCTPEEARRLFGMPDVSPINDIIVAEMKKQAKEKIESLADPEQLVNQFVNMGGKGFEQFQQMMMSAMAGSAGAKTGSGTKTDDKT